MGIKPTFVRVFQMISDLVTPNSVGLYREEDIKRLLKLARWVKILRYNNVYVIPIISFLLTFVNYMINENIMAILFYGTPNALLMSLFFFYSTNITLFQFFYFYIICEYLELKVKNLNERVIQMQRNKRFVRIREILYSFDVIYREINEYNTTYWSKFLAIIWLFFGTLIVFVIYILTNRDIPTNMVIVISYGIFLAKIGSNLIISKSCSLNLESKKSYKIFNSLIINISKATK